MSYGCVIWVCIFVLKLFGLIEVSWWVVAPMVVVAMIFNELSRK